MKNRTIKVDYLARVEGEGGLYVKMKGDQVIDVKLKIFEPPRFFEALLRGRDYREAPDITARICGICPVAYQMSAVHAMENALDIKVTGQLRALRRLLYCGEWIESHTLHIYMLHAPDFLGYQSAVAMAKDHAEIVKRGLQLKKIGNQILKVVGGREIHPINVRVGGFYRLPALPELIALREQLIWAREAALQTVQWVANFPFPELTRDYLFVAMHHSEEYPFNEGRLISNNNLDITAQQYEDYFEEEHVAHSNALHSHLKNERAYFLGPLARYNLNFNQLSLVAKQAAIEAGLTERCVNPFKSIIVRAVEVLYACDEAIRIIDQYQPPDAACLAPESINLSTPVTGYAFTEAPRGMLYHRYRLAEDGKILVAKIVPPTSQNQLVIESDLRDFVTNNIKLPAAQLTWQCEQAVRNYDPCISCATHFLKLEIEQQ